MEQIEIKYGGYIRFVAKKYSHPFQDPSDMSQDVLIAVHKNITDGRLDLGFDSAVKNSIFQMSIVVYRKHRSYHNNIIPVEQIRIDIESSDETMVSSEFRIKELKHRIRKSLSRMDARILIEITFPSPETIKIARHRSKCRRGVQPTVWKIDVAKKLHVSNRRVTMAIERAKRHIPEIIESCS